MACILPGTGPAGYNNENARALLADPISSTAVIQSLARRASAAFFPIPASPPAARCRPLCTPSRSSGPLESPVPRPADSKYDSLQMKATKRLSHGLQAGGAYTWAQGFTRATRQDFFNPASAVWALQQIPPQDSELQRHLHRAEGLVPAQV